MKANHSKKYAGKTDILQYALALMTINGGVTTNEVKHIMRKENYWLRQEEVSVALNELSEELNWDIHETGAYRIYQLPGTNIQLQQSLVPAAFLAQATHTPVSSAGNGISFTDKPSRGDWFVFDYGNPNKPELFVTGTKERNAARYFYSKEYDTLYSTTAANEIS